MIHAYNNFYVSKAQERLGDAFDYAVNTCGLSGDTFSKLFAMSSISRRMENGEPAWLVGKSGIEVAADIIEETTHKVIPLEPTVQFTRSKEYWVGWVIAYYQWYTGRKYSEIFQAVPFDELQRMYDPLHEADISKVIDILDQRIHEYYPDTNLKRLRIKYGCTQAELAKRSGVSLRSIQMYEQRKKDINKAGVESVARLAKVLGCEIADLIEK